MTFNYLPQADRDTLESFYTNQAFAGQAFLLSIPNDNAKTGAAMTPAPDGTNKVFQIAMPAQTNIVGTPTILDNGAAAGANTVTASGVVTFTTAPASGHTLTANFSYAYVVRFNEDQLEINQFMNAMYEQQGITFRTVR